MKYCQNCGTALDDNARFCIECGGVAQEREDYSPPLDYSTVPLISQNTVLNTVRECAKSPLFLVAIIAYSLTLILSLISLLSNIGDISVYYEMYYDMPASFATSYRVGTIIGTVIGMAPSILMAVGMWMTYASASGKNERMSTSGLTIIKVIAIIMLVLMCVAAGMVLIVFGIVAIVFCVMGTTEFADTEMWTEFVMETDTVALAQGMFIVAFIIMFILIAAISALAIIYYAKIIKTINVIKSTIATGTVTGKISAFVAVMTIIYGAFMALFALASLIMGQFVVGFSGIVSAAGSILFGALLFSYRSKISAISTPQ